MGDQAQLRASNKSFGHFSLCWAVICLGILCLAGVAPAAESGNLPSLDSVVAKLPRFAVAGKVVDKDGQAVAGADVFLYYVAGGSGVRNRLMGQTKTAADGGFRLENAGLWEPYPTAGGSRFTQKYYVIARHPQHGIEFTAFLQSQPTEKLVVRMDRAETATVRVVDTAGKPVAGVRVHMRDGMHGDVISKQITAEHPDDAREYQYFSLWQDIGLSSGVSDVEGMVSLLVTPGGSAFKGIKEGYAEGFSSRKEMVLCPGARISGRVTYPDGSPAAGAGVMFNYGDQRLVSNDATLTDADGRYHLDHLPGSGFYWSGLKPEDHKGQGTGALRVVDLRPGSTLASVKIAFPLNPGDNLTKDLMFTGAITLAGRVVDVDSGQPLAGISFYRYLQVAGTTALDSLSLTTDAQGRFSTNVAPGSQVSFQFYGPGDGSYLIDPDWRRSNLDSSQPFREVISQPRSNIILKLKLVPVQPLTGRVVDDKGQPVAGATVYVHPVLREGHTDAAGNFTMKAVFGNRDFDLCAVTDDKKLGGLAHLKAGATQATITLAATTSYEGQVTTPDNLPAGNLRFSLDPRINGENLSRLRDEPTTDAQGKFKVANLIPGAPYYVFWSSDQDQNRDYDYGNASIDLAQLKPGEPIRFQAMQFLDTLMGKVVDQEGLPIAGAIVGPVGSALLPQDARSITRKPTITDNKGEFSITRLGHGTIALRISARGYKTGNFKAATDSVDFQAKLASADQPAIWDLAVVDEAGKPVANAPILLWQRSYPAGDGAPTSTTRSIQADAQGKVHLTAPVEKQPSTVMAAVDMPGHDVAFARLSANEDASAQLVVRKSSQHWSGMVLDENGKPLGGATVRVTNISLDTGSIGPIMLLESAGGETDPFHLATVTDAQGRFELSRLSNQFWTNVNITAPGRTVVSGYFDPARDKGSKTFTLVPGARVTGRSVFSGGAPASSQRFSIYFTALDRRSSATAKYGPDWTFSADNLRPASYRVMVRAQDKSLRKYVCPTPVTVEALAGKTAEVVVNMEEGIPLRGKLIQANGQAVSSGSVSARLQGDEFGSTSVSVEADGSWEIYPPSAGNYDIQYYVAGMSSQARTPKTVAVEKGKATEPLTLTVEGTPAAGIPARIVVPR